MDFLGSVHAAVETEEQPEQPQVCVDQLLTNGSHVLVRPEAPLQWPDQLEADVVDAGKATLRSALGFFFYQRSSWQAIGEAVAQEPVKVAAALQAAAVDAARALHLPEDAVESGDIVEPQVVVVSTARGGGLSPWSVVSALGGQRITHNYDWNGGHTSETRINVNAYFPRLPVPRAREVGLAAKLEPLVREAAGSGDSYVMRLSQWYSCTRRGPQFDPEWESELVLLRFRRTAAVDRVVSVRAESAASDPTTGSLAVSCRGLSGDLLATLSLSPLARVGELRSKLAQQLGLPHVRRLKLIAPSGLLEPSRDAETLRDIFCGQSEAEVFLKQSL